MSSINDKTASSASCPKSLWVASFFADDEAMPCDGELPQGLRFHLSRCPSCRALADKLSAVASSLGSLSHETLAPSLMVSAQEQALSALRSGGVMSGRTDLPDLIELPDYAELTWNWPRFARLAAAAVIVISVSLYGIAEWTGGSSLRQTVGRDAVTAPLARRAVVAETPNGHDTDGVPMMVPKDGLVAKNDVEGPPEDGQRVPETMFSDGLLDDSWQGFEPALLPASPTSGDAPYRTPKIDKTETIGLTGGNGQR